MTNNEKVNHNQVRELLMAEGKLAEVRHYNNLLKIEQVARDLDKFCPLAAVGELVAVPASILRELHKYLERTQ
jgi:hypothetical protein